MDYVQIKEHAMISLDLAFAMKVSKELLVKVMLPEIMKHYIIPRVLILILFRYILPWRPSTL